MPKLIMLVGPPGSGKSTFARDQIENGGDLGAACAYVNQDSQGKLEHMNIFRDAIHNGKDIIVDRMNFNKVQRLGYIEQAKKSKHKYEVDIHVFHEPYKVCLRRATVRTDHETIKDEATAEKAIGFFFKSYERVEDNEADRVIRHYPGGEKPSVIVCDLDGTLADCGHRRHHVRAPEGKKKNWMAFMDGIKDDKVNQWCADILKAMAKGQHRIVYCSGRGEEQRHVTERWLKEHDLDFFVNQEGQTTFTDLYMRPAGTSRQDAIVKEIILDFEILTRYTPYFMIDDRKQVVDMWRKRGFVCLQCDEGDF